MDTTGTESRPDGASDANGDSVAVTSARAQFDAAAPRAVAAGNGEPVFDRFDWSGAVGATVQAATVHLSGARDGAREVLTYDLGSTGLLACSGRAGGDSRSLHFVSASGRDAYERALRSVGYRNLAAEPQAGERRFDVEVIDATGFAVRIGERTVRVEARPASQTQAPTRAAPAADGFDTLEPEVIRFDLDDHVADLPIAYDETAFAARARFEEPTSAAAPTEPEATPSAEPGAAPGGDKAAGTGDRFAAHYGNGFWVHRQSAARAAAARPQADAPAPARAAPSFFRDSAEIYHIFRPAGATAVVSHTPRPASVTARAPAPFVGEAEVRVFRRRPPAPGAAAHPSAADDDPGGLHFADMFEGDVGPDGLEQDPAKDAERDFLFGLGRTRAA